MPTEVLKNSGLSKMSDASLVSEFHRRLTISTESLISLAEVVGEMMRRGIEPPESVNPLLIDTLRKIESGQIYAPLAERFMHHPIFMKLKALALDDQKRVAETGKVEVAVRRGDKFDTRIMEVASLQPEQKKLVFAGQRIRSVSEQTAVLESIPVRLDDQFDEAEVTISVPLTVRERKALAKRAAAKEQTVGEFVCEFLRAKKVI